MSAVCARICWLIRHFILKWPHYGGFFRGRDTSPRHTTQRSVGLSLKRVFEISPALVSGTPPPGIVKRLEHMFNRDRSTPYQLSSPPILFLPLSFSYSFSPPSLCGSGLGEPIYATGQLSTGQPGRLQRSLKCEMLFLGLHRTHTHTHKKWSSGENKSCHILNSGDTRWMCNQVTLLYFAFTNKPPGPSENHYQ